MDLTVARKRLEGILAELDSSQTTLQSENAGDSQELSHFDNHSADTGTELSDQDREEAMLEAVSLQREQVNEALARIEDGSYGRCIDCGKVLPKARLDARPEAARCVEDQAKAEAAR